MRYIIWEYAWNDTVADTWEIFLVYYALVKLLDSFKRNKNMKEKH